MSSSRSPLLPIFLTVFVDVLGLTLVLPLLPFYAEHFGASPFVVGTLQASYAACQLFSGPALGRISDRVGRRPTLLVSQIGTFLGFLTIGLAHTLWMLFVGRIIDGLTAGNLSIAQAYISDATKPEDRTRAFGVIGIAFGMGFLVGPAISGFLAHRFGYSAPAFGAAALSFTSIVVTAVMLREVPRGGAPDAGALGGQRTLELGRFFQRAAPRRRLLEFFAFALSFSSLFGGLALFLERRMGFDVEKTGYVFGFAGFIGALIQGGLIGRLSKRLGDEKLALVGLAFMAIGNALVGAIFGLGTMLIVMTIAAFGMAVARPTLTALITKSVDRSEQGAALGTSQSLASIAAMVGPLCAGWLIEQQQLAAYGIASGAFALIGVVLRLQGEPVVT